MRPFDVRYMCAFFTKASDCSELIPVKLAKDIIHYHTTFKATPTTLT